MERRPFLASKAVIFGVNLTGPHILYVTSEFSFNDELFDSPQRNHDSDVYDIIEPGFPFHMAPTNTDWEMGIQHGWYRTLGTRGREELDGLSVIRVAIQIQGPSLEKKAVMKPKIQ